MQTALRTFLIPVSYIPKSVRIAKHSLFPRRSSKLCSSRVLKFFIVSFPFVYSRILTRLFPFGKYIRSIPTPHTGFEPVSHYGPTVFKTAPSPPGHTAYKGDEDRTHTYGIKTRCAAITLRPYHDSRGTRTPNAVFLQHRYSKPAPYLLGYTATIFFHDAGRTRTRTPVTRLLTV